MPEFMKRRNHPVTVLQATLESPTLARLAQLGQDSVARLQAILPLIPKALQTCVKAGPIDGMVWCLLVENSASAAKLRQMLPSLESHLRSKGWAIESIRLKVQKSTARPAELRNI